MNSYQHNTYKQTSHMASKTRQIVMLYDGVIKFLNQAKEAIKDKRLEDRYWSLQKAADVLSGMQICLDFEKGGEIAKLLSDYYAGMDMRISAIQRSENLDDLDSCINHLKIMRDAWEEVDAKQSAKENDVKLPEVEADGNDSAIYDPSIAKTLAESGLSVSA